MSSSKVKVKLINEKEFDLLKNQVKELSETLSDFIKNLSSTTKRKRNRNKK